MTINVDSNTRTSILLGIQGENEVTTVTFDTTEWESAYPGGRLGAVMQRNGDKAPYPIELDGNVWVVSNIDTAKKGRGKLQLYWLVDDKIKKSLIHDVFVNASLSDTTTPPDPYQSWVDEIVTLVEGIEESVDSVEAATTATQAAQIAAETAATTATNKASEASTYATTATSAKDTAVSSKNAAIEAASNAQTSAEAANGYKNDAETAASTAEYCAEIAQSATGGLIIDDTLTIPNQAADAKRVGDLLTSVTDRVDAAEAGINSHTSDIVALDSGKVDRSGDTVTGNLIVQSSTTESKAFRSHAMVTRGSLTNNTSGGLRIYDYSGQQEDSQTLLGYVDGQFRENGDEGIRIGTIREVAGVTASNALWLEIDSSGNRLVKLTAAVPWLTALGLNNTFNTYTPTFKAGTGTNPTVTDANFRYILHGNMMFVTGRFKIDALGNVGTNAPLRIGLPTEYTYQDSGVGGCGDFKQNSSTYLNAIVRVNASAKALDITTVNGMYPTLSTIYSTVHAWVPVVFSHVL